MEHDTNYWGLAALYIAPSLYFLIREFFFVMDGYKFCINKGITIGLVPGIGHIAAFGDLMDVLLSKPGDKRNREDCK